MYNVISAIIMHDNGDVEGVNKNYDPIWMRSIDNKEVFCEYDSEGRPIRITSDNYEEITIYHTDGSLVRTIISNGRKAETTYNTDMSYVIKTYNGDTIYTMEFNSDGDIVRTYTDDGEETIFEYDENKEFVNVTIINKNGEITKYTVDNDTMNSVQGCLSA